jgi:CBS domain-containing protein
MRRWIYTYRYVDGDPQRLEQTLRSHSDDLLRLATGAPDLGPGGDGSFLMDLEGDLAGIHVAKRVRVSVGVVQRDRRRIALPITWQAEPARALFPRFSGTLEFEPLDTRLGQLTLSGMYTTPLGLLGGAFDATLLRDLSHGTAERLVDGVARELTRRGLTGPVPEHPAGPRRGPLHVRDVMTSDPILLDESLPLRTAALILFHGGFSGAPVVGADGRLVGVLSEADLLAKEADERFGWGRAMAQEDRRRQARTVADACSAPAFVTSPDARLAAAAREMLDHRISRLVVVGEGRVLGIISRHDVLAALIRDDRELLAEIRMQLDARGLRDIDVKVEWGHATLSGTAQRRSSAAMVHRLVENIDGVIAVSGDNLGWIEDDVLPTVPAPM